MLLLQAGSVPREPLLWGQGRGCGFVSGRCNQNAWKAPGEHLCDSAAVFGHKDERARAVSPPHDMPLSPEQAIFVRMLRRRVLRVALWEGVRLVSAR